MRKAWQRWVAVASIPMLLGSEGCLSRSYRVSQSELLRLSQLPPGERWQSVRATQGLLGDDIPPQRNVTMYPVTTVVTEPVSFAMGGRWRLTPPRMDARWSRRGSTLGSGTRLNIGGGSAGSGRSGGGSGRSGGGGGSGGGSGGGGGSGSAGAVILVAVVLAAGVIVFVLAGSEGARYDGWMAVNPNEDLYLEQQGQTVAVPLSALTPELALSAYSATLYEGPEDRFGRLARAPLNRVGFTITTGVGIAGLPADGAEQMQAAFSGHTFVGYFPMQQLGFGVAADVLARNALVGTVGPELRAMPLLNAGAYLGGGWVFGRSGGTVTRDILGNFVRAGFLGELPVTTRMAFQLRAGLAWMNFNDIGSALVPEASAALAIY